jgi:hypothetical protein
MLIKGAESTMLIYRSWKSRDIVTDDLMMASKVGVTVHRVIQSPPGDFLINILLSD